MGHAILSLLCATGRKKTCDIHSSRPIAYVYYATPVQYVETGVWSWPYLEGRINIVRHPARAHKYDSRLPRLHISKVHVRHILAFVTNPHVEQLTHIHARQNQQILGRRLSCRCGLGSLTFRVRHLNAIKSTAGRSFFRH
jgi:hypothetical protein